MTKNKEIKIHILVHMPPIVQHQCTFQAGLGANVATLVLNTLKDAKSPSFADKAAFELAIKLKTYDRIAESFLDPFRPLGSQNVKDGTLIIASLSEDAEALNKLVQIKKLSTIERLAMEIRNGK